MPSAFDGVFTDFTLTRAAQAAGTDSLGNTRPKRDAVSVRVFLRASRNPALREAYGVTTRDILFTGRLIEPVRAPTGFNTGFTTTLTYLGVAGTLTIVALTDSIIADVTDELGQAITAVWKAP